jgi:hypothetical protein
MTHETEPSIAALTEQLACYRKLARLSALQRTYVQQNQTDELIGVLESRGILLNDIARLEQLVSPLKRHWNEQSLALNETTRTAAQQMLAEAKELLQQITQADQDDVLLLQQRKLNVGKQIQATGSARRINTRYAASAYGAASGAKLNVQQ